MAQNSGDSGSALDKEAAHVDKLMQPGGPKAGPAEAKAEKSGLNNATQVDQDNRVAKAKQDAVAAGGGPDAPEAGLNQDG